MIVKMGFAGYFLIVADFIQWAKDNGVPVGPGRGSGAGSLVAWSLKITDLDPLRWGCCSSASSIPSACRCRTSISTSARTSATGDPLRARRVRPRPVAAIITFGKLQARAVLRDVGRVLGMPYGQVDRICKLVPNNPGQSGDARQGARDRAAPEGAVQRTRRSSG
jgi:DNA polymerase-3 subunit alpha